MLRSALFPLIAIVLLVYLAAQTLTSGDGSSARIRYSELIATAERSPEQIREVVFVPTTYLPFVLFFGFWILLRRRRASERSPDDLRMRIEQLEREVADLRATVASGLGA